MSQPQPVASSELQQHYVSRRRVVWLTVAAFGLRLLLIFAFHTYRFPNTPNHLGFAYETGSIAGSLATAHGFSSPFGAVSGPTAWISPIYPAIVAAAFLVFGLYTHAAAIAMLIFNSLCSALTVPAIYVLGRRAFNERTGEVGAWIWALVPFFARWPVTWIWETALSAMFCALVFLVSFELQSPDWRKWAGLGVFWGVIALASPSLMGFLPPSFLYPAWRMRSNWWTKLSRVAIATLFFILAIAPWMARNQAVFHRPVFLRSNFWFEASLSNYHTSTGEAWSGRHPALNPAVLKRYIAMGEPDFAAAAKREVFNFVRTYPTEFAKLVAIRIANFWDGRELIYESSSDPFRPWMVLLTSALAFAGLWMAIRARQRWGLFGWLLLLYPVPYYLTYTNPRYRHPIEPMMVVLTAFFFVELWRRCRAGGR